MSKPILEIMKRDGYCRSCDDLLIRDEHMAIKLYSFRNRGQNIILCLKCVDEMYQLINPEGKVE